MSPFNSLKECNLLKKDTNELLCRTETESQTLKNLWLPKGTGGSGRGQLGVWDGKVLKLDCDDGCTTINTKFIELKKKERNHFLSIWKTKDVHNHIIQLILILSYLCIISFVVFGSQNCNVHLNL